MITPPPANLTFTFTELTFKCWNIKRLSEEKHLLLLQKLTDHFYHRPGESRGYITVLVTSSDQIEQVLRRIKILMVQIKIEISDELAFSVEFTFA